MDVDIGEIRATVRAVDSGSLLTPEILQAIVRVVMRAVEDKLAHDKRLGSERKITDGVSKERDAED
ncbi:MAG: hypothetical protein JWN94_4341 [Betaproteobacteria bacterium]|nr:hypothetical protein [Betaproteobacteria bacterium]